MMKINEQWTVTTDAGLTIYTYSMQQCNQMNHYYEFMIVLHIEILHFFLFLFINCDWRVHKTLLVTSSSHRAQSRCSPTKNIYFFAIGWRRCAIIFDCGGFVSRVMQKTIRCAQKQIMRQSDSRLLPPQTKQNANTKKRFTLFLDGKWR